MGAFQGAKLRRGITATFPLGVQAVVQTKRGWYLLMQGPEYFSPLLLGTVTVNLEPY